MNPPESLPAGCPSADELAAKIANCNNGYIFIPSGFEILTALAFPDRFMVHGVRNSIYLCKIYLRK